MGVICMKRSELREKKNKSKKKWWIIPLAIIGVFLLVGGGWFLSVYLDAKDTVNEKMHQPVDSIDHDLSKKKIKAKDQLNILIMGIDAEKDESQEGRSDALMVMTLRPEADSMQLISIPRDTRTFIVGRGEEDKINHAFAYGGASMAIATVENLLDIELDYHVNMNMQGLTELVNEVGGVTVTSELEWQDGAHQFVKGENRLENGEKALAYVRMRKQDPTGDFGRAKRQRQVVEALIKEGASIASIGNVSNMIEILGDNMGTSLDFSDMQKLLTGYMGTRHDIESYQIQGEGTTINGIYYYIVAEDEIDKVHGMIVN